MAATWAGEGGIADLAPGDVDGDAELGVDVALPGRRLAARLLEHLQPQLGDQPGLLGDRDELERRDHPALGMLPADERLGRDRVAGGEVDHRLIPGLELAALERRGAARSRGARGPWPRCASPRRTARSAHGRAPWPGTSRRRRRPAATRACRARALARAMPMLSVKECSPLPRTSGAVTAVASRCASSVAPRMPPTSGQITMNSSPLSRRDRVGRRAPRRSAAPRPRAAPRPPRRGRTRR